MDAVRSVTDDTADRRRSCAKEERVEDDVAVCGTEGSENRAWCRYRAAIARWSGRCGCGAAARRSRLRSGRHRPRSRERARRKEKRLDSGAVRAGGTSRSGQALLPRALAPTVQTYSGLPNGSSATVLMPGCEGHFRGTQRNAAHLGKIWDSPRTSLRCYESSWAGLQK